MNTARLVNVVLGGWLFQAAFLWRDGPGQAFNMGLVGLVISGLALFAKPGLFRLGTALVALWLFCSPFVLPSPGPWSVWNDCLLAVVTFGAPLSPSRLRRRLPADPRP